MISLFRLDQLGASVSGGGKNTDLGSLPTGSKALLITLGVVWILIGLYFGYSKLKGRKNKA
jgi:hypothetical protein